VATNQVSVSPRVFEKMCTSSFCFTDKNPKATQQKIAFKKKNTLMVYSYAIF